MASNDSSQAAALAHLEALHTTTNTEIAAFQARLNLHSDLSKQLINALGSGELTREKLAALTSQEDDICKLLFKRLSDVRKAFGVLSGLLYTFISTSDRAPEREQKLLRETLARKLMLWDFLEGLEVITPDGGPATEVSKNAKAAKKTTTTKADRRIDVGHEFVPYKDEPEGETDGVETLRSWGFKEYDPNCTSAKGKKQRSGEEENLIDL